MTKYMTNFARTCLHHWTVSKAIMEFVQNWLDSDGERDFEFGDDYLILTNKNIKVSNKLLMMGASDKRQDNTKRGLYGLGSTQAIVVLTDQNIPVEIQNNDVVWIPEWEHSDLFDDDVLVVNEVQAVKPNYNFTVSIFGLTEEDISEIKQRCTVFQDRKILYSTEYGDIIENLDDNGEVFCGDIYVCQNKQFKYSYNFKPKGIKLSQDRDAVSQWDLQELTSKLIIATGDTDFIVGAIKLNGADTQNINRYWEHVRRTTSDVDDVLANEFLAEHGAVYVTHDYSEHQQNLKLGNKSVYIENETIAKSIAKSEVYQEAIQNLVYIERESFRDLFENLFDNVVSLLDNNPKQYVPEGLRDQLEQFAERVRNKDFD